MTRKSWAVLVCAFALTGSLAACSSNETQDEAEAAVCTSLTEVQTAVDGMKSLSASSTVDEVEAAQQALDDAVAGLKSSAAELNEADVASLESSADAIKQAVAGVSGDDTLGEAATSISTSTQALQSTVAEMRNGVQCS